VKLKLILCSVLIAAALPLSLSSQPLALEDPRQFYTDISGHHGLGTGAGATEQEAVRIAKADAISMVFGELNKDDMFTEIFISRWPEAIVLKDTAAGKMSEGRWEALVRVRIDLQAVLMTEQTYQESAVNLLDRAEKLLEEAEPRVKTAQGHEENMRLGEAFTNYKQAASRLDELTLLLSPLGDSSLQSRGGNSKPALMNIAGTLRTTVESGLARLAEIEAETEVSETTEEIRKTYELLAGELGKVQTVVDAYIPLSPFYDLPRTELDVILLEIRQSIDLNGDLGGKLEKLKNGVPADKVYLLEKIDLSCAETEKLEGTLKRLEGEVKREIRVPRLVRQERAYKRIAFGEKMGHALLRREPGDIFILRYYLPIGLETGTDTRFGLTRELELEAAVEYYFNDLVWFQTALWKDDLYVDPAVKDIALAQEAHIGFGRAFFAGGGAGWDWGRWVKSESGTEQAVGNFAVNAFIGGIDKERQWPWGILMLKVPVRPGLFVYNGKLNLAAEMKLRIAALFQLEAGISSGYYNIAPSDDIDEVRSDPDAYIQYQFRYFGLFGVRLPKPFLWGIRFEGGREGPNAPEPMLWRLFLQYSL
jgi:hypothetical protein